jgi:xanthine dehydrogenase molybdopterin-binding subunit B
MLQVEIDLLTGASTIVRSDLIYDCGQSLNPAVDLGQVGFIWLVVFVSVIKTTFKRQDTN